MTINCYPNAEIPLSRDKSYRMLGFLDSMFCFQKNKNTQFANSQSFKNNNANIKLIPFNEDSNNIIKYQYFIEQNNNNNCIEFDVTFYNNCNDSEQYVFVFIMGYKHYIEAKFEQKIEDSQWDGWEVFTSKTIEQFCLYIRWWFCEFFCACVCVVCVLCACAVFVSLCFGD